MYEFQNRLYSNPLKIRHFCAAFENLSVKNYVWVAIDKDYSSQNIKKICDILLRHRLLLYQIYLCCTLNVLKAILPITNH